MVKYHNVFFQWQINLQDCLEKFSPDYLHRWCPLPEVAQDEEEADGRLGASSGACSPDGDEEMIQIIKALKRLDQWRSELSQCQTNVNFMLLNVDGTGSQWGLENKRCSNKYISNGLGGDNWS